MVNPIAGSLSALNFKIIIIFSHTLHAQVSLNACRASEAEEIETDLSYI